MKTLDKIINAVTCNGMRELEEERCRQIAEEYALAKVNQARKEERAKHAKLRSFAKEIMRDHRPSSREYQDAKEALEAVGDIN